MSTDKAKPRLGRGLSSLISVHHPVHQELPPAPAAAQPALAPIAATPQAGPTEIFIGEISPNPLQPRRTFNDASLQDLANSIKTNGLIQPVIVKRVDGGYQLVAGERRLRAAKLAGLKTLPAIVREVDTYTQAQLALVENIQREDLNPIERAAAYRALMDQLGLTQAELATRLGEDRSSIANYLRLLDLCESAKSSVRDGQLSLGHAKILASVADVLEQERLTKLAVSQDLSVRNLERLIANAPPADAPKARKETSAHILELEKRFARDLGMRVQIRSGSKGKGRVIIHYASLDQFDTLQAKLGVADENV